LKIVLVIFIAGLLYAFYKYRINQLKIQQRIRRVIASDLHDDIGSTLNSAKVFMHLARKYKDQDNYLQLVEESIREAAVSLRDIIWVLDDDRDSLSELSERIYRFGQPVAAAENIEFSCALPTSISDQKINKPEKKTLFLIAKEAVNNCIKHAQCSVIRIEIFLENNKIVMTISDNGKGFSANETSAGNGLKNMQYRASQVNYSLDIRSTAQKGVTLKLRKN